MQDGGRRRIWWWLAPLVALAGLIVFFLISRTEQEPQDIAAPKTAQSVAKVQIPVKAQILDEERPPKEEKAAPQREGYAHPMVDGRRKRPDGARRPSGLYDPGIPRGNCGVGFVATLDAVPRHDVVENGGLMVDPRDGDALCQVMFDIYRRPSLHDDFSRRSIKRVRMFSWDASEQEMLRAFQTDLRGTYR